MRETFDEFLFYERKEQLLNEKNNIENEIENSKNRNELIKNTLDKYNKRVVIKRAFSFYGGLALSFFLFYLSAIIIKANIFTITEFLYVRYIMVIVDIAPIISGVFKATSGNSIDKRIEKKMNIDVTSLNREYSLNEKNVHINEKKLIKVNAVITELEHLKQVYDLYESGSLDKIIEEEKKLLSDKCEKEKTLELIK